MMKKLYTAQYNCIVEHFADGDTVCILHECDHCFHWQKGYLRIRGIESEELRSPEKAKALMIAEALTSMFKRKDGELHLTQSGCDKYGRMVGDITIDGKMLSDEIVKLGYAWYTRLKK